jgi:hypothetical protein
VREIAWMKVLLDTMSQSLLQLELALEGQTRVSIDLEHLIDAFCHDLVPTAWCKVVVVSCIIESPSCVTHHIASPLVSCNIARYIFLSARQETQ